MRGLAGLVVTGAAGLLLVAPVAAKDAPALQLSGATRWRYETIADQPRAGVNRADALLNVRTVLGAEWRTRPVRIVAELWDSRAYGADAGTPLSTGEVNTLELVQFYAQARLGPAASLTAGRFLLNLGSRRLVAADEYRNTTNGYTGLRLDTERDRWHATAIYVLPQQRRPDDPAGLRANRVAPDREGFDQQLWGGLVTRTRAVGPAAVEASFFHFGERDRPGRPTRDRLLDTLALRLFRDPAPRATDLDVEVAGQWGRAAPGTAATATRLPVRAWYLHAELGRSFAGAWRPRLAVEYDHASGDRPGGRYGRFDTLFGMRRAELAPAGLYNAVGRANLISPGLRVEVTPSPRTDAFIGYRPLWLAAREDAFSTSGVRDATGRSGRFAGHQIDARLRHRLTRAVRLEADGVLLAKGRFLRDAPNAPPGRLTRYLSLNATIEFR